MKKLLFALIIMFLGTSTNAQPQEGNQFDPAAIKERQKSKEKNWIQQNAEDADLEIDDYLMEEIDSKGECQQNDAKSKKNLDKLKAKLNSLLNTPLEKATQSTSQKKRGFIVVAK